MKKHISTIIACICFLILVLLFDAQLDSKDANLYSDVLRLHVIANSNSAYDQELKYKVRDDLLNVTKRMFYDCKDVPEALKVAQANKKALELSAEQTLRSNNCDKAVSVHIGKEMYPSKTYGSLTFPKGEYLSVRVKIGDAVGRNWWCVLYPPLCNAGVEEGGKILSSYGIDEKEIEKLEKEKSRGSVEIFGCTIKLKILEIFG